METRRVQKVGYSTLVVSLPRKWVMEAGLKKGDSVAFRREEDGSLRLITSLSQEKEQTVKCIINADLCQISGMLTRMITGSYIIGYDLMKVTSKGEIQPNHLEEIRRTTQSLTGIGIVEQDLKQVTIQSFIDPTKFPVDGLLRRLHVIALSMQSIATRALFEQRHELANEATQMEEEADRIYWLVVRQLLLAVRNTNVRKMVGIESPLHIVGNRVVAKSLEEMADCAEKIAKEVLRFKNKNQLNAESRILKEIAQLDEMVRKVSEKTGKALFSREITLPNQVIEEVDSIDVAERKLVERMLSQVSDVGLAVGLRSIVMSLRQIAEYCDIIAEITINRILETSSDICKLVKE